MLAAPARGKNTGAIDSSIEMDPLLTKEIELSQPLPIISARQKERIYRRARCLVRLHTQPLGVVEFPINDNEIAPAEYIPRIWQELGDKINKHLRGDSLLEIMALQEHGIPCVSTPQCIQERETFLQSAPFASVVVSTRERPERLARCIAALLEMRYPRYEIVVVDNAPVTAATREFMEECYASEPKVRYVCEKRPGLSAGRNRGILEARGEIIAITDDDVVVDSYWLAELVRGFAVAEDIACVTGLLLPLELETPAQILLEAYGGFSKGFSRRIFDLDKHRWKKPSYPYIVGACGSGASMAFTAKFLRAEGGFDLALGTGTPSRGGEDLAAIFAVLIRGHRLVYEPAALLYHQHHRDYADLQKQLYGYGVGHTAYLTKILINRPWLFFDIMHKFVRSMFFLLRYGTPRPEDPPAAKYPKELKHLERKGLLVGPQAYVRSRWTVGWTRKGLDLHIANT